MALDWPNLIVGFVLGLLPAFYFFYLSGKQLRDEAGALKALNIILLRGAEQAGWMTLARDSNGNITGMAFREHFVESITVSESVRAVIKREEGGQDRK